MAVDAILEDAACRELSMPTAFDDFSPWAASGCMDLPAAALRNRELLHTVMRDGVLAPSSGEWWLFDYVSGRGASFLPKPLE